MLFFTLLSAQATSNFELWAQGHFRATETMVTLEKEREQALQETLSASNILIQALAASKLEGKPHICATYDFITVGNTMKVTCDARPTIDVKLDGTPTKYPTKDGTGLEIIATITDSTVIQKFQGSNGGMEVRYQFAEGTLIVTKKIDSSYLGKPLTMVMHYQQN